MRFASLRSLFIHKLNDKKKAPRFRSAFFIQEQSLVKFVFHAKLDTEYITDTGSLIIGFADKLVANIL